MRTVAGRYTLHAVLASGGMATVHFGRLRGAVGFKRIVAIKRLLPQYASDPEFVAMFVDEARLASRIRHPNVVPTLDVVSEDGDLSIVMDYVHGETLSRLIRFAAQAAAPIPADVACRIVQDMLAGLQAAHEAKDERGAELGIVHRDVSPQNVIVGVDGITRLLDFGIARAHGRSQVTREGQVKGKLSYMAPEQLMGQTMTRSVDIFAAAVVLWEVLVGRRLFQGESEGHIVHQILHGDIPLPSVANPKFGDRFDAVVMKGLARKPEDRFATARDFALALSAVAPPADAAVVGDVVNKLAAGNLAWRSDRLAEVERESARPPASEDSSPELQTEVASLGTSATRAVVTDPANALTAGSRRSVTSTRALMIAGIATLTVAVVAVIRQSPTPTRPRTEVATPVPNAGPIDSATPIASALIVTPVASAAPSASAAASGSAAVPSSAPSATSANPTMRRNTTRAAPIPAPGGRRATSSPAPSPQAPAIPDRL